MRRGTWMAAGLIIGFLLFVGCAPVDDPAALPEEETADSPAPVKDGGMGLPRAKPPAPPVPDSLRERIEAAVKNVRRRELTADNAFWTVFHGILGLGPNVELTDPETRNKMKALDYITRGGDLRGLRFRPTPLGVEVITTRDSLGQGHQDQFVAEMAQWGMPADRKFVIDGREYSFLDFARQSQARASVKKNQELSWTIIIVGQYLGMNATWTNVFNEQLSYEDMVRYEVAAPIETAACGGTHRLFGLSWVYHVHLQKGGKPEGVWLGVVERTNKYRDLARKWQNPDGSFSTSYFRQPGNSPDKNLRINTTGHILEWLALALSDEELRAPWVQEAASALSLQILDLQGSPIDSGSMYHAVHGLLIYHSRVFGRTLAPEELLVPLPPGWKKI